MHGPIQGPQRASGPALTPDAADLQAVGVAYYGMLTARHPVPEHQAEPLWMASFNDRLDTFAQRVRAQQERRIVPPRDLDSTVTDAEQALAMALLELRVTDRAALTTLAAAACV